MTNTSSEKQSVLIATPVYGGTVTTAFHRSIGALADALRGAGISHGRVLIEGCSLISAARNACAHAFLKSPATHLLFVDADQGFPPDVVLEMLRLDKELIAAEVPKKAIDWERVRAAALAGEANLAAHAVGPAYADAPPGELVQVRRAGTGLMLIRREVFERIRKKTPQMSYVERSPGTAFFGERLHAFFDTMILDDQYLGEDHAFCERWRREGGKTWLYRRPGIVHVGPYVYGPS